MEYALIAAATAVTISSFMPGIGNNLSRSFSEVRTALIGPAAPAEAESPPVTAAPPSCAAC